MKDWSCGMGERREKGRDFFRGPWPPIKPAGMPAYPIIRKSSKRKPYQKPKRPAVGEKGPLSPGPPSRAGADIGQEENMLLLAVGARCWGR